MKQMMTGRSCYIGLFARLCAVADVRRFREVQVDMTDVNEVFSFVSMVVQDTPAAPFFLSILQHLMLIRDDEVVRFALPMCSLDLRSQPTILPAH
jgi:hypothetical protein